MSGFWPGFRLFGTRSGGAAGAGSRRESPGLVMVEGLCTVVRVEEWPAAELRQVYSHCAALHRFTGTFTVLLHCVYALCAAAQNHCNRLT